MVFGYVVSLHILSLKLCLLLPCGNRAILFAIYFICLLKALKKLQVTPYEAEPCIPQYFVREREEEIKSRRGFIEETLRKLGHEPEKQKPLVLTEQQAVLIIQSHERARQGRLRLFLVLPFAL